MVSVNVRLDEYILGIPKSLFIELPQWTGFVRQDRYGLLSFNAQSILIRRDRKKWNHVCDICFWRAYESACMFMKRTENWWMILGWLLLPSELMWYLSIWYKVDSGQQLRRTTLLLQYCQYHQKDLYQFCKNDSTTMWKCLKYSKWSSSKPFQQPLSETYDD